MDVADASRVWVDFSSRLRSFSLNGGRDSELDEHETTTAEYVLDDRDRELDPTNVSSTYAPDIVPNRMVRHTITDNGVTYDVFKGFVDTWGPEWDEHGVGDHRAHIRASDARKTLTRDAFEAADPDVLDYPDVISADEPNFYLRLGEPEGTKAVQHVKKKRKRREHEGRRHYHRHGFKRWSTRVTRAEAEGISGPAGTYSGLPTLGVPGLIAGDTDTAVKFDGVNDNVRVQVGLEDSIDTNRLTIEAWVNTSSASNNTVIVSGPYKAAIGGGVWLLMQDNTQKAKSVLFFSDGTNSSISGTSNLSGVYHLVSTWDGTTHRVYVNGTEEATNTPAAGKVLRQGDADRFIRIGCEDDSPLGLFWPDVIDEVAVYEKTLSASRILAHYNAGLLGFDGATTGRRILQALELQDPGSIDALTFSGNEITDTTRLDRVSGDGRPRAPFDFMGGYETGDYTEWSTKQEAVAGRLTYVDDPAGGDGTVGRFEVQSGDTVASGERLEVTHTSQMAAAGDNYFYGWSVYIPSGWVDTITGTQFKILNQWKDSADLGPPNFALRAANGDFKLQINTGASAGSGVGATVLEPMILPSFLKDVWHDFIMEVNWQTGTGWVRVWHKQTDGAYDLLYENTAIPTLLSGGGTSSTVYAKEGLYRDITPRTETDVLYHDDYRIGRSFYDVAYGEQAPEGTTGIWPSAINLCINGNATTNTTGSAVLGGGAVTRESGQTDTAFGTTRYKTTTPGSVTGEGFTVRTALTLEGTSGVAAGDTFIASAFLKGAQLTPSASSAALRLNVTCRINYSDATTTDSANMLVDLMPDEWMRVVTNTATDAGGVKTIDSVAIRVLTTGVAQDAEFYVGGVQIEEGTVATPYIETDGSAVTRSAARVQAAASGLDETQGWLAAFVRVGWPGTSAHDTNPYLFRWRDDDNNELRARYNTTGDQWSMDRRSGGSGAPVVSAAQAFPRDGMALVIGAWTSTQTKVSVNGAPFVTAANTNIPTLAATTFDIGSSIGANNFLSGDVRWAIWGTGTITDANALSLYNYGPWASGLTFDSWYGSSEVSTGWNIMPGTRTMPPARYAGLSPMEIIDDAVAAEGDPSFFYVTPGGTFTFRDASHRSGPPFSKATAKFGNGGGQLPFNAAALSEEDAFLFNIIRGSTDDGTRTFTAEDQTSIDRFGRSVLPLDTLPLGTDAEIQAYVDALLARFKNPLTRIPSFTVTSANAGVAALLTIDLGHLILVEIPPPGGGAVISQQSYVEARKLSADAREGNLLRAEFSISPR